MDTPKPEEQLSQWQGQKFALISYRPEYTDRSDDRHDSQCNFDNDLSYEKLEARIEQLLNTQEEDASWHSGEWRFLVLWNGIPLVSRGDTFFGAEETPVGKDQEAITADLNESFRYLGVKTEEEKKARVRKQEEENARQRAAATARAEYQHYQDALKTIEVLGPKHGPKPETKS